MKLNLAITASAVYAFFIIIISSPPSIRINHILYSACFFSAVIMIGVLLLFPLIDPARKNRLVLSIKLAVLVIFISFSAGYTISGLSTL